MARFCTPRELGGFSLLGLDSISALPYSGEYTANKICEFDAFCVAAHTPGPRAPRAAAAHGAKGPRKVCAGEQVGLSVLTIPNISQKLH